MLFLTARDAREDKITGLTVGGDDYATKPFSLGEVIARVRAILRRAGMESEGDGLLRFVDVVMDEESHEVWRNGTSEVGTDDGVATLRVIDRGTRRSALPPVPI